jgi:hypothetical protein
MGAASVNSKLLQMDTAATTVEMESITAARRHPDVHGPPAGDTHILNRGLGEEAGVIANEALGRTKALVPWV